MFVTPYIKDYSSTYAYDKLQEYRQWRSRYVGWCVLTSVSEGRVVSMFRVAEAENADTRILRDMMGL
jgi:hypothetical protein